MSGGHNIPPEIQIEIIKRLPVKSLIQFRSVSKSWKSLMDSSNFISSYTSTQTHLFIWYQSLTDFKQKFISILDNNATFPQNKFSHIVPKSIEQLSFDPILVGTSHGPYENVLGFGVYGSACDVKIVKVTYVSACDLKRRRLAKSKQSGSKNGEDFKTAMDEIEWQPLDERLLMTFGNIRYGVNTTWGRTYGKNLYGGVAASLSTAQFVVLPNDVGWRIEHFRGVYSGNPNGPFQHPQMRNDVYDGLLRRCFDRGPPAITIPSEFSSRKRRASRNSCGGSSSRSFDPDSVDLTEKLTKAMTHLMANHTRNGISIDQVARFGRFVHDDLNMLNAKSWVELPHDLQLECVREINLDSYNSEYACQHWYVVVFKNMEEVVEIWDTCQQPSLVYDPSIVRQIDFSIWDTLPDYQ